MSPDDPRHGTWAGYGAGCRNTCCREAARLYQKRRLYERRHRMPVLGIRRRIEALACLGWDTYAIGRQIGVSNGCVRQWLEGDTVYRSTHDRMAAAYDYLSMRLPPTDTPGQRGNVAKARNRAARNNWAPPLAYDDIDDPDEAPKGRVGRGNRARTDVDEAVVRRVMEGEHLHTTTAERREIRRRWVEAGRRVNDLERLTGWKVERYRTEVA